MKRNRASGFVLSSTMGARNCRTLGLILLCALAMWPSVHGETLSVAPTGMALVPTGRYTPLFRGENDPKDVPVPAFLLDAYPVTNAEFLEFVRANPKWRRSQVK